jgi:exonuclease SbcD
MRIVIVAGNHDSAMRLHADNSIWGMGDVVLVGMPPVSNSHELPDGWQNDYIVRLPQGYIIAMPYYFGSRSQAVQSILDFVANENTDNKPVVLMGHLAVNGMDISGLGMDVGRLQVLNTDELGKGYDYMALGHIHRPQTLGFNDEFQPVSTYPSGIIRYSGSALHVSCDEKFPHSVSLVTIDHHGGPVTVERLRIQQLRHFFELPAEGVAQSVEEIFSSIMEFAETKQSGYFRLKINYDVELPPDLNQQIYSLIEPYNNEVRYNPKAIYFNAPEQLSHTDDNALGLAVIQQMTDPMDFIRQTIDQYPGLDIDMLADAFKEVEDFLRTQSNQ